MKVLVTGANGQLGTDLCTALDQFEVIPLSHKDIEITNLDCVRDACYEHRPGIIINTAAYVRVDDCETDPDKAFDPLVTAMSKQTLVQVRKAING